MKNSAIIAILVGALGSPILGAGGASSLLAQSKAGAAQPAPAKLTAQETRGEGLFLQRCSLCHLPRKLKFGSPAVVGPNLSGLFKQTDSEQERLLRGFILKGGPNMPGFQYGLEPQEIDDLMAYLKTL